MTLFKDKKLFLGDDCARIKIKGDEFQLIRSEIIVIVPE